MKPRIFLGTALFVLVPLSAFAQSAAPGNGGAPPTADQATPEATKPKAPATVVAVEAPAAPKDGEAGKLEAPAKVEPAEAPDAVPPAAPFAFADFTWANGQSHQTDFPLAFSKYLTPSLYLDSYYAFSGNHPRDNTLVGGATTGRHNELSLSLASVGVEWNYKNVIGRLSLQFGSTLNLVQDTDGTAARGRSLSVTNLRNLREAAVGYHFNAWNGINVEAGIFSSFVGLESYLTAENWNYSRALVSEGTPFYFQGIRTQIFPSDRVKIEPWIVNGWQSYGKWNYAPGLGLALHYRPSGSLLLSSNFYGGSDTRGNASKIRFHHDHSLVGKLYDAPTSSGLSKLAVSLNNHAGFETGAPLKDGYVLGTAVALRGWLSKNTWALTLRGEALVNPSGYVTAFPPPGYSAAASGPLRIWGVTASAEYFVTDFFSLRGEVLYRKSTSPYFAGPGGTTSGDGYADTSAAGFVPDLVRAQTLGIVAANFRL